MLDQNRCGKKALVPLAFEPVFVVASSWNLVWMEGNYKKKKGDLKRIRLSGAAVGNKLRWLDLNVVKLQRFFALLSPRVEILHA